jgi:hypothetical protein
MEERHLEKMQTFGGKKRQPKRTDVKWHFLDLQGILSTTVAPVVYLNKGKIERLINGG